MGFLDGVKKVLYAIKEEQDGKVASVYKWEERLESRSDKDLLEIVNNKSNDGYKRIAAGKILKSRGYGN